MLLWFSPAAIGQLEHISHFAKFRFNAPHFGDVMIICHTDISRRQVVFYSEKRLAKYYLTRKNYPAILTFLIFQFHFVVATTFDPRTCCSNCKVLFSCRVSVLVITGRH